MSTVIKVENISKQYRLGDVGTGSLAHDLNRSWHKIRGKEDPYLKIGEANDRTVKGSSDYVWALKDINFEVQQGEVIGIIGRNGAGKSTLLKILSRTTMPTTGNIKIKGRIASLLEVGTGFHPELSGRDNIFLNGAILGMTKREIKSKFDEIVDFAGVERYIDTPVKRYSSGMYVRLAFGVAAHLEPEILIVDEVLAVGDLEFQKKALGKMKDVSEKGGRTVLFVSHNMDAVRALCTSCIILEEGKILQNDETSYVLNKYIQSAVLADLIEVPFVGKAGITRIMLNRQNLENGELKISVSFRSNEIVDRVNPGFVIYNALSQPVFGTNLLHRENLVDSTSMTAGVFTATISGLQLHSGIYTVSVWLGNSRENFDHLENIMAFEHISAKTYQLPLNPNNIGYYDPHVQWTNESDL